MNAPESWAWLARISRPQGRKGEVWAEILTDFPEKFAERKNLWLLAPEGSPAKTPRVTAGHAGSRANTGTAKITSPREVELRHHWLHKGGVVLHFAGIDSITDAEILAGLIVAIPAKDRAPLGEDEVYVGDLIGCSVFDVAKPDQPVLVGEIEDVDRSSGPVALLILRSANGEVLIPFAKSFLRLVDIDKKRIEMALPEGLVDLNPPQGKTLKVSER